MSRIRPARFVHVVYRSRRFEEMVKWYEPVFDAQVRYQNPVLAFLSYDDEHHRIALINMAVVHPDTSGDKRGTIGVDHVAYTYSTVEDLLENYAQLKDKGIHLYSCIHHVVTLSMYYADPEGNQMELQVDACATTEEANAYMMGEHFTANPIGVEYDPDEMLAKLRSGTPGSALLPRKADLPVSPIRGALQH